MSGTTANDIPHLDVAHIVIVGLGLIGGSMARGLRARGFTGRLTAAVANREEAERALTLALVDHATTELAGAVADADLIVIAVPIGAMGPVFEVLAQHARADAVITDVGSGKLAVLAKAKAALGATCARFVPGHPISGTERSGLDAGFAELFAGRRTILTPTTDTEAGALATVRRLWTLLGAEVCLMDAAHHDEVLAASSHLPHVLAYTLVDTLAQMAERTEIFEYAAGGFRDFTRIASSDPALWRDIVSANRTPMLAVLDRYMADLARIRAAIEHDDRDKLFAGFERAKIARDQFAERLRERHEASD